MTLWLGPAEKFTVQNLFRKLQSPLPPSLHRATACTPQPDRDLITGGARRHPGARNHRPRYCVFRPDLSACARAIGVHAEFARVAFRCAHALWASFNHVSLQARRSALTMPRLPAALVHRVHGDITSTAGRGARPIGSPGRVLCTPSLVPGRLPRSAACLAPKTP